jgi:acyl-CoA reductase-like NAD-dependent aldehyde dehydrogenase
VLWGAFVNSGQTCASVEKLYVPRSKLKDYRLKLKEKLESLDESNFGYMTNLMQKEKVEAQLKEALGSGGSILSELNRSSGSEKFRLNPVILDNVDKNSKIMKDETFGPVLPIIAYDDLENTLSEINDSPYGLTASVWTGDFKKGEEIAEKLDVGVVTINDHLITPGFPEAPWVGSKESGMGFSNSLESVLGYCRPKFVYHDRGLLPVKFWLYPLSENKRSIAMNYIRARFSRNIFQKLWNYIKVVPRFLFKF